MLELSRTVRFCINPDMGGETTEASAVEPIFNSYGGWPSMRGLGAYYEIEVRCRGEAEDVSGYMMGISGIDRAVREAVIPRIARAVREDPTREPATLLRDLFSLLTPRVGEQLWSVCWRLTPFCSVTLEASDMGSFLLSQRFDFAAAHRLHCASMSDEENREVFGKCNNPNGHGHNYQIEVEAAVPLTESGGGFGLQALERLVDEHVIQRLDHTHLNLDTGLFDELNPTVENIARTCHDLLAQPVAAAGAELKRLTVWETEKTSCTYPAGP